MYFADMVICSSKAAAEKLGISLMTLQRHIGAGSIRFPKLQTVGGVTVRLWSLADIERARKDIQRNKAKRKKLKV
jgi:predicted site-specific integrase-resolvase